MDNIPLEIVLMIASSSPDIFIIMIQVLSRFYRYILTASGKRQFLNICMGRLPTCIGLATCLLPMGLLHSFFDEPTYTNTFHDLGNLLTLDINIACRGNIRKYSTHMWYLYGKRHRIGGPAVVCVNGDQYWYQYGKIHRIDGPAIIYADGTQFWYQHDIYHRTDGPAVTYANGACEWWVNGYRHRKDDPTRIYANGTVEWRINGVKQNVPLPAATNHRLMKGGY